MAKSSSGSKRKVVSLTEIALEAEVSRMTASRVLRGADGYSEATRDKVLAVAQRLGYVPNRIAAALGSDTATSLVAIALPTIGRELYNQILEGLESKLTSMGYQPIVGVVGYDDDVEYQWLNSALAWRPCALVVAGRTRSNRNRTLLQSLSIPVVELWNLGREDTVQQRSDPLRVGLDHRAVGLQMGQYLRSRYRGKAGYVGVKVGDHALGVDRLEGFEEGYGQSLQRLLLKDRSSFYAGYYGTEQLLSAEPNLRVLYYLDDNMAVGGLMFCQQKGIKIPGDVAIAGFGGLDVGSILPATLTTTNVRRLRVGKLAAQNLIKRVNNEPVVVVEDVGFELLKGETS
ncbi:LacI family DNA-binding transcriptional regulator [Granulosicoccus sp. 3-233]|uniref:LacI family DNA-binding transcriptional regulator n=1 Tax=Granulosicoccus sp. 3-233 TaxID=3417969 RepID=UPI003D32550A